MTLANHLKPQIKLVIIVTIFIMVTISCDWPFNTDTTDGDVFKLSISHNIERVMPTAEISLSWTEITVENFIKYQIEKRRPKDSKWTFVKEISDPFQLSYTDTIADDDDLTYRVGIFGGEYLVKWAEKSTIIPKITKIIIPDDFTNIRYAVESELIDPGDEIFVKPGEYTGGIELNKKDVNINSAGGFENTIINGGVKMSTGIINGFTITGGSAVSGAGCFLSGNSIVKNCFITNNYASIVGGGIYMGDSSAVYNSIIYDNFAERGGNGIFIISSAGEVINNTLVENDIVFTGDCEDLIIRNNIVHNVDPAISPHFSYDTLNFTIDYCLFNHDYGYEATNITGDPQILDYENFELDVSSPCIDAGHPDEQYNDMDGTRNDIGSYGGQFGNGG